MSRVTEPVAEAVVRLSVNGEAVATWTASPYALDALGVGRLRSLGYVGGREDVLASAIRPPAETGDGTHHIDISIPADGMAAGTAEREHRARHGCGLRYLIDCRPDLLPARDDALPLPPDDAFPDLFRALYDRSPSRRTTGGHHTTALTDGTSLLHLHEVVGRHNGADKAIGAAILAADDPHRLGMITTARISGQIAEKAARAGIAWVASRSVPTTLAVEIAKAAGMPLVARAAGSESRSFGAE